MKAPDSKPAQAVETPDSLLESFDRLRMTVDDCCFWMLYYIVYIKAVAWLNDTALWRWLVLPCTEQYQSTGFYWFYTVLI